MKSIRIRDTHIDLKKLVKSFIQKFEYGFYTKVSLTDGNILDYQNNRGHNPKPWRRLNLLLFYPIAQKKIGAKRRK